MAARRPRSTDPAAVAGPGRELRGGAKARADLAHAEAVSNQVLARAARGEYLLIGPSARTWRRDPATGDPLAPASDAEHLAVRALLGQETLGSTEPTWVTAADGDTDVHSIVTVTPDAAPDQGDHDVTEPTAEACSRAHGAVTAATSSPSASAAGIAADREESTRRHAQPDTASNDGSAAGVWC